MATSAVQPILRLVQYHHVERVDFLLWTERLREIPDDRLGAIVKLLVSSQLALCSKYPR
jgi:hypothetical protein